MKGQRAPDEYPGSEAEQPEEIPNAYHFDVVIRVVEAGAVDEEIRAYFESGSRSPEEQAAVDAADAKLSAVVGVSRRWWPFVGARVRNEEKERLLHIALIGRRREQIAGRRS